MVIFSIAFAYIEAAVVVYLRTIFHRDGFTFPLRSFGLSPLWRELLLTEMGREAATLILMFTGAWLFGRNLHQRFAFFSAIFATWDIFYYLWLKLLSRGLRVIPPWPGSLRDWDILFLIPTTWAGPIWAPILISVTLLLLAVIILYRDSTGRELKVTPLQWAGFILAGLMVVISFCHAGSHITQPEFRCYFHWWLFSAGYLVGIVLFIRCLWRSGRGKQML